MTGVAFRSADQIATAIVQACRLTGDKPIETLLVQGKNTRARILAYVGLRTAFTEARASGLARSVGFKAKPGGVELTALAQGCVSSAKRSAWWREDWVDEILGALVADRIEG